MPKLTFLFQCREQAAENAPGTRMPCQAFTRKTKIIITSSWQSDCLSPQAFCHLASHVLGSAKSVALRRRGSHATGRRHHSFRRWMHHEPLPDLWQAGDVENSQPAVVNLSAIVCAEINAIPRPAIIACLIVSLDPISMPMRGSMPCWARNCSANKRVPEPTSRIRMVCLADLSRRDRTLLG
jgi:hypothetical protein